MGAAESTSRTNGTNQEEEKRKQKSSTVVRAAATIAAVGITAWVLSDNTDTQEDEERKQKSSTVVEAVATIAAVGVVAWGISRMLLFFVKMISRMLLFLVKMISRMLFDNTDTQENVSAMKMKMIDKTSCVPEGKSQTRVITWSPPSPGRLKMNTAGGYRPKEHYVGPEKDSDKLRPSGYGGILRDHNGKWIRGFNGYFGAIDNQTAELHGIHKGLELLDKLGYKGAILETDNTGAYDWVTRRDDDWGKKKSIHDSWNIIIECRDLAKKNNITIERIDRKANKCARGLTKSAIKKQVKYEELVDLPKEIDHFYYEEYC